MLKALLRFSVLLFIMGMSKSVFACLVTIAFANPVGPNVQVYAHSTHVGPPMQMIATFNYTASDGTRRALQVSPRVERDFNVYTTTLAQGSSNISVSVTTGVGPSCGTKPVSVPYYQSAFWYSQLMSSVSGCELLIQTLGSPGIYVPWYYGGSVAWWTNDRVSDFHGVPVYTWRKYFPGANCSTQVRKIDFKIMGDPLRLQYSATPYAQNG